MKETSGAVRGIAVLALAVSVGGCDCGGGEDAGVDAAGPGTDATGPGTDATGPGTDATGPGTDAAGPGTDAAATDAAASALTAELTATDIFLDCMPIVPSDPWNISFTATYMNGGGTAATATITAATLTLTGGTVLDLTIAPSTSGVVMPGATAVVMHMKTASTPDIPMDCSHCGEMATLDVTWDAGGTVLMDSSGSLAIMCAF